jgi:hypothetical protein
MNYDYLCSEKTDLNYKVVIVSSCGNNVTITLETGEERLQVANSQEM